MKIKTFIIAIFMGSIMPSCKSDAQTKTLNNNSMSTTHEEEWDFYLGLVDDKLASILVDLGLYNVAPITKLPNVVWISVKMNKPKTDGLSSQEESAILNSIEDKLTAMLRKKTNSLYVGRVTSNGYRDLYFYFGDTTHYSKMISDVMNQFSTYKFTLGAKEDMKWSGYFDFLYPTPQQMENIQNRHVVEQLEKGGDKLTKPRDVFHWIYFKSENDREAFLEKIKMDNFIVVKKASDKSLGELSCSLQIKRVDKVDLKRVNEYTHYLWKIAQDIGGKYDGWETSIEKD